MRFVGVVVGVLAAMSAINAGAVTDPDRDVDGVLIVTIDALRADRLSSYGYERPTSPEIDALYAEGARFVRARTPEPLTTPAMSSMVTSLPPHLHGASRNGLRMEPGLDSLPKVLSEQGWQTAAFVGNWTLRDEISRLGEHFNQYEGVFTKKRWFGLFNSEATGEDLTERTLEWLDRHLEGSEPAPFLVWVHYVEPHAPYVLHDEYLDRLGLPPRPDKRGRYDTEVAAVDEEVGRLVSRVRGSVGADRLLLVVLADHGESLGEHDYWGHGRHLWEPSLHIPMGITWPGRIEPAVISEQALLTDVAPTVLSLLGVSPPESFTGFDWGGVLLGEAEAPRGRGACFQAHKGAVQIRHESERARTVGLLEVGRVADGRKEIVDVRSDELLAYDLGSDPAELRDLTPAGTAPSPELAACVGAVMEALGALDRQRSVDKLDDETVKQLKALGYLE